MERMIPQFSQVSPGLGAGATPPGFWRKSGMRMGCVKTGVTTQSRAEAASRIRGAANGPFAYARTEAIIWETLLGQALNEISGRQQQAGRPEPAKPGGIDLLDFAGAVEARQYPIDRQPVIGVPARQRQGVRLDREILIEQLE